MCKDGVLGILRIKEDWAGTADIRLLEMAKSRPPPLLHIAPVPHGRSSLLLTKDVVVVARKLRNGQERDTGGGNRGEQAKDTREM